MAVTVKNGNEYATYADGDGKLCSYIRPYIPPSPEDELIDRIDGMRNKGTEKGDSLARINALKSLAASRAGVRYPFTSDPAPDPDSNDGYGDKGISEDTDRVGVSTGRKRRVYTSTYKGRRPCGPLLEVITTLEDCKIRHNKRRSPVHACKSAHCCTPVERLMPNDIAILEARGFRRYSLPVEDEDPVGKPTGEEQTCTAVSYVFWSPEPTVSASTFELLDNTPLTETVFDEDGFEVVRRREQKRKKTWTKKETDVAVTRYGHITFDGEQFVDSGAIEPEPESAVDAAIAAEENPEKKTKKKKPESTPYCAATWRENFMDALEASTAKKLASAPWVESDAKWKAPNGQWHKSTAKRRELSLRDRVTLSNERRGMMLFTLAKKAIEKTGKARGDEDALSAVVVELFTYMDPRTFWTQTANGFEERPADELMRMLSRYKGQEFDKALQEFRDNPPTDGQGICRWVNALIERGKERRKTEPIDHVKVVTLESGDGQGDERTYQDALDIMIHRSGQTATIDRDARAEKADGFKFTFTPSDVRHVDNREHVLKCELVRLLTIALPANTMFFFQWTADSKYGGDLENKSKAFIAREAGVGHSTVDGKMMNARKILPTFNMALEIADACLTGSFTQEQAINLLVSAKSIYTTTAHDNHWTKTDVEDWRRTARENAAKNEEVFRAVDGFASLNGITVSEIRTAFETWEARHRKPNQWVLPSKWRVLLNLAIRAYESGRKPKQEPEQKQEEQEQEPVFYHPSFGDNPAKFTAESHTRFWLTFKRNVPSLRCNDDCNKECNGHKRRKLLFTATVLDRLETIVQ